VQVAEPSRVTSHDLDAANQDRRITRVFWAAVTFAVLLILSSLVTLRAVVESLGGVAFEDTGELIAMQKIQLAAEVKGRKARGFLLTGNPDLLSEMKAANAELQARFVGVPRSMAGPEEAKMLERIEVKDREYQAALDRAIALRTTSADAKSVSLAFEFGVQPAREELSRAFLDLSAFQERRLHAARADARGTVSRALTLLVLVTVLTLALAVFLGQRLTRALRTQANHRREIALNLDRLKALNQDLDAFAGRVSHDLRNLLAPVAMASSMLPRFIDEPGSARSLADKIQRGVDRSLAMMAGLLAFSRSAAPEPGSACSVASVLEEALDQLAPEAARVGVTIRKRIGEGEVACSRELLDVVVVNVLGNAFKFLEGRERREVSIVAQCSGGSCEIAIEDTGPGIPEPDRERIFEAFYRVPGVRAPGQGIGLATVARIVHAHGGTIEVESELGVGTTFRVRLPAIHVDRARSEPTEDSRPG
jgi:signal transduction histidine kinase